VVGIPGGCGVIIVEDLGARVGGVSVAIDKFHEAAHLRKYPFGFARCAPTKMHVREIGPSLQLGVPAPGLLRESRGRAD